MCIKEGSLVNKEKRQNYELSTSIKGGGGKTFWSISFDSIFQIIPSDSSSESITFYCVGSNLEAY